MLLDKKAWEIPGGALLTVFNNAFTLSLDRDIIVLCHATRDWMERLQSEGIRGADLVFACIGPALEIFSRCSKVVDAEERE